MPIHGFTSAKAQGADGTVASANEWNDAHIAIKSTCAAVNTGTAVPLTITNGGKTLNVELCEITCDGDNDADVATVANGSTVGHKIDLVCVGVSGSTTNTLTIQATFTGGGTSYTLPWSGSGLVQAGMSIVWDGAGWVICGVFQTYGGDSIEFWEPSSADPPAIAGIIQIYAKSIAGRIMPKWMGPSGVDTPIQPFLSQNKVIMWSPGTGTALSSFGSTPTTATTLSNPVPAITNAGTWLRRTVFTTSTTAGNASGAREAAPSNCIGSGSVKGGFFFQCIFNQGSLHTTGVQKMVGMSSSTAALAGEPSSSMADFIGLCLDSTDTAWQFSRRTGSGTATKVSTGITAAADVVIELTMFIAPAGTTLYVRVRTIALTGAATTALDTSYTTVLPAATTILGPHFQVRNGALAAAHNMGLGKLYLESDF